MNREKLWTRNFVLISIANFFLFITYYSLLVTLPTATMQDYNVSETIAGLYTTVFLFAAIIVRFFIGNMVLKFGKRSILMLSFIIFAFCSFVYGLYDSAMFILVIRFFQGIGFGLATAITATLIADIVPDSRKGEGMGYFVMSSNVAMVIGPFVGLTIFSKYNILILFWIAALSALIALILSWLSNTTDVYEEEVKSDEQIIFEKRAIPISLVSSYLGMAYASILSFLALFSYENGFDHVSSYFFTVFAFILLLSRPFTGMWFDRYGSHVIIYPAIILFSLGMFVLGQATSGFAFLCAAGLLGLGWGTLFPSFQTLAVQSTVSSRWSLATATYLSIFDSGIGIGSFVTGLLIKKMSLSSIYTYFSIYILIGIVFYYLSQGKKSLKQS